MNLGIIGGLGPETSSRFCLDLNRKLREKASVQPHLIMDNLPISLEAEQKIINNGRPVTGFKAKHPIIIEDRAHVFKKLIQ